MSSRHSGRRAAPPWLPNLALPLVPAEVNGVAGRFLLDKGVGETLIDPALVGPPGLAPLGDDAQVTKLEVAVGNEGEGFGVHHSLSGQPLLCRSLKVAGLRREHLIGILPASLRVGRRFGFRIGGLVGDGFVNAAAPTLDFQTIRLTLSVASE